MQNVTCYIGNSSRRLSSASFWTSTCHHWVLMPDMGPGITEYPEVLFKKSKICCFPDTGSGIGENPRKKTPKI